MRSKPREKNNTVFAGGRESRVAVFAGSFDPFTVGHLDLVKRAAGMFDSLIVLVAQNANKKNLFAADVRKEMVEIAVADIPNVSVAVHEGLTVDYMKTVGACFLVRGIRNALDLGTEQAVAWNNKVLYDSVETVLLLSNQDHLVVSSSLVRELLKCGKDKSSLEQKAILSKFVPKNIISLLLKKFRMVYEAV